MKILPVIFICLLLFLPAKTFSVDWDPLFESTSKRVLLDSKGIKSIKDSVFRVWIKIENKLNYSHELVLCEINCREERLNFLSLVSYYRDGTVKEKLSFDEKGFYIPPDSTGVNLIFAVCSTQKPK